MLSGLPFAKRYIGSITFAVLILLNSLVVAQSSSPDLGVILFKQGLNALEKGDFAQAFYSFFNSAKEGYPPAMNNVAYMYQYGKGTLPNIDEAISYYYHAAELGSLAAIYNIGVCYYYGIGIQKDSSKALEWISHARQLGHQKAHQFLQYRDHPEAPMYWSEFINFSDRQVSSRQAKPVPDSHYASTRTVGPSPESNYNQKELIASSGRSQFDDNLFSSDGYTTEAQTEAQTEVPIGATSSKSAASKSASSHHRNYFSFGKSGFGGYQRKARDFRLENEWFVSGGHLLTEYSGPFIAYKKGRLREGVHGTLDTLQIGYRVGFQEFLKYDLWGFNPWFSVLGERKNGKIPQIDGAAHHASEHKFDFAGQIGMTLPLTDQLHVNIFAESAGKSLYFSDRTIELKKNPSVNLGLDLLF